MNSALLVIDVQRGLFDETPRPHEASTVIARINDLARRARERNLPIFVIQHERGGGRLEFESESWQLARELEIAADDTRVRKTTPDSFLRTPLLEKLQAQGIAHLVICGYASEFCVDTTTRRAAALGFSVTLAADAHTTHDKDHASAAAIRAHENATLPCITSFGPRIEALDAGAISFA